MPIEPPSGMAACSVPRRSEGVDYGLSAIAEAANQVRIIDAGSLVINAHLAGAEIGTRRAHGHAPSGRSPAVLAGPEVGLVERRHMRAWRNDLVEALQFVRREADLQ